MKIDITREKLIKLMLASIDYGIKNNYPVLVSVASQIIQGLMRESLEKT